MSDKRKTAVEWLIQQLTKTERNVINKTFLQMNKSMASVILTDLFDQAKQIEREQIIESYYAGTAQFANEAPIVNPKTPEEYYEQTYGKDNDRNPIHHCILPVRNVNLRHCPNVRQSRIGNIEDS
jgi:hypothetical protein